MWYLGKIKGVELELLRLLKGHDLDIEGPGWVVALGNGVEQVSNGIIWVGGSQVVCFCYRQILYSLIGLKTGTQDMTCAITKQLNDKIQTDGFLELIQG